MHLSTITVLLSVALADAAAFVTPNRHRKNKVSSPNIPFEYLFQFSYSLGAGLPQKMLPRPL
jgi:hypothetical protein